MKVSEHKGRRPSKVCVACSLLGTVGRDSVLSCAEGDLAVYRVAIYFLPPCDIGLMPRQEKPKTVGALLNNRRRPLSALVARQGHYAVHSPACGEPLFGAEHLPTAKGKRNPST